jgi:hypothetical protein
MTISDASFSLKPFSHSAHCGDLADKWLDQFLMYCDFKKLDGRDQLQLFKLLMKDQARDWLNSLPDYKVNDIHDLITEFKKRHELTRVDKWRQTTDIWRRQQRADESVNDYVTSMQTAARRIDMADNMLVDAIIQGLLPEIRLFVLQSGAEDLDEICQKAKVAEAARAATQNNSTHLEQLSTKIDTLLEKIANNPERKVTFSQSTVAAEPGRSTNDSRPSRTDYRNRDISRSPSRSPARPSASFDRTTAYQRQQSPNFRRDDRGVPRPQTSWRPPFRQQSPGASYGQPAPWRNNTSTSYRPRFIGNNKCFCCGRDHARGRQFCPAANLQCHLCGKIGHIAPVCCTRSRLQSGTANSSFFNRSR